MPKGLVLACSDTNGMTFTELVVVLAIISLSVAGIARYPELAGADRIQDTSAQLLGDLQWIRRAAMTPGADESGKHVRGAGIRFESASEYRLFSFNDRNLNSHYDGPEEENAFPGESGVRQKRLSSPALKIHRNGALEEPQNAVLLFDHSGFPRTAGMGFEQLSIVVQYPEMVGPHRRCVTVNLGRIREGRWEACGCREE